MEPGIPRRFFGLGLKLRKGPRRTLPEGANTGTHWTIARGNYPLVKRLMKKL